MNQQLYPDFPSEAIIGTGLGNMASIALAEGTHEANCGSFGTGKSLTANNTVVAAA